VSQTAWEKMAKEANHLLGSKLKEPLTGADLLWLSIVITRNSGDRYAAITLEDIYRQREANDGSP
jgi:hypothetical protein